MSNILERADKGLSGFLRALTMSSTERANSVNRGVIEYRPCEIAAFFEASKGVFNSVISGGDNGLRIKAVLAQVICAYQNNFPVIILHEGNWQLEQTLKNALSGIINYNEISPNQPCFEPFYELSSLEISNQILETAAKDYDIKVNVRYYIEGISALIKAKKQNLSFWMFESCPHDAIFDKVDEIQNQGRISDVEAQKIKSQLMMGQSENYKLDTLLKNLQMEIESMMYTRHRNLKPMNIISALKRHSVLCFDISSITNKLLFNTVISQLKLALTKGISYTIIIDSIPTNSNDMYASYMHSLSEKVCRTIVADDFYSMVGSDEKIFSTLIGNTQILIVMQHPSANSAMKWAEVFGQYDKYEESYSKTKGTSKNTPFSIFSSPNYSKSVNTSRQREYIVKPEAITRMATGEAYVLSMARGELAHLTIM